MKKEKKKTTTKETYFLFSKIWFGFKSIYWKLMRKIKKTYKRKYIVVEF